MDTQAELKTSDFDYELPQELIAQTPAEPRDSSRLMVLDRTNQTVTHRESFRAILDYLKPGDALVVNESKVIPARLFGKKVPGGGQIELLLLRPAPSFGEYTWEALVRPGRGTKPGARFLFGVEGEQQLAAVVLEISPAGGRYISFERDPLPFLEKYGQMPLPPYIHQQPADPQRYQTVYANPALPGSAAAPTAGLHFTPELLQQVQEKGVRLEKVTLHVGLDTFQPVKEENALEHKMHSEWCAIDAGTVARLNETRAEGGRIVAVGTTAVRTLETAFDESQGQLAPFAGDTRLFIYPGKQLKALDGLITNFHLPKSTLMMLISAFAGRDFVLRAYREAVAERYRFFSFGDAMLIL
jgi:S-adenosylmethionine:tRNA ribosyltransferase-isomerase